MKGYGAVFAILLLLICELVLHTDSFLLKYRSVFASGRMMDKIYALSEVPIDILLVGNSRTDNGFDALLMAESIGSNIFNLGIPGANMKVLYGIVSRLSNEGKFDKGKINKVLLGLDESVFQPDDSLGYGVFVADRKELLRNFQFKELFCTYFRLFGYGAQLKGLREPAKLSRFIKASFQQVEPVGGSAKINYGFRPGERKKFQNDQQIIIQEAGSERVPNKIIEDYFWKLIRLLQDNKVTVAVFFPPLLNRETLFLDYKNKKAKLYIKIKDKLQDMNIPVIDIGYQQSRNVSEYANAGHLNRKGAARFSKILGQELLVLWPKKTDQ